MEVPSVKVEEGVVAVPAQGPAHQEQLIDWPDNLQHASMQFQLLPFPRNMYHASLKGVFSSPWGSHLLLVFWCLGVNWPPPQA